MLLRVRNGFRILPLIQYNRTSYQQQLLPKMEALSLQVQCTCLTSPSYLDSKQPKKTRVRNSHGDFHSLSIKRVPRRLLLQFTGFCPIMINTFPVSSAPIPDMKEPEVIRTLKLPSGVRIQAIPNLVEIIEGEGTEAHEGDLVEFNYVCRRSNGYFVHSTVDQFSGESTPVILPLDENQIIKGLKEVLTGMRIGGKRRAFIPPSMGYVDENLKPVPEEFGPRRSLLSHASEPLIFEVQLLKVL